MDREYVERLEAVVPSRVEECPGLLAGQGGYLLLLGARCLHTLSGVACDQPVGHGLRERLPQRDVDVLHGARAESLVEACPVEAADIARVKLLELDPAERGLYVDAHHLLVALEGALPDGVLHRVGQPAVHILAERQVLLVGEPTKFPALLYDRYSVGIILTYVWKEVPFVALVVLAGLRGVAGELEEVARTLGANAWQRFWYVVFPVIAPGKSCTKSPALVQPVGEGLSKTTTRWGGTLLFVQSHRSVDLADRPAAMAINVLITLVTALSAALYLRLGRGIGGRRGA